MFYTLQIVGWLIILCAIDFPVNVIPYKQEWQPYAVLFTGVILVYLSLLFLPF